jgi:hypothetical protein
MQVLDQMDLAEELQREKRINAGKKGGSKAAPKKPRKKAASKKLDSDTEGACYSSYCRTFPVSFLWK